MSHDRSWRAACLITITNPLLHFEINFHSTRRDSCGRWLRRLVGPCIHFVCGGIELAAFTFFFPEVIIWKMSRYQNTFITIA
jgi:hypothetical protein